MTVAIIVLALVVIASLALAGELLRREREARVAARELHALIESEKTLPAGLVRAHLSDDEPSIEGILLGVTADHYRLANAKALVSEDQAVPLAGEAWLPAARVLYLQRL